MAIPREVGLYFGWILLFLGSMLAITASSLVTQGNIPAAVYATVGYTELVGTVIVIIGVIFILRNK